MSREKKSRAP